MIIVKHSVNSEQFKVFYYNLLFYRYDNNTLFLQYFIPVV